MIPQLETERLILRDIKKEDLPIWQKYFNNWEVIRHLSAHVPWPYPDDGVEFFYNSSILPNQGKTQYHWTITLKNNPDELIGSVTLYFEDSIQENRGFWLAQPFWGKGIMTEACEAVNRFAFEDLKQEKLIFCNAVGNNRSRRVKEKTGARFLRIEPYTFVDPNLTEHELWELTKEDWLKMQNN